MFIIKRNKKWTLKWSFLKTRSVLIGELNQNIPNVLVSVYISELITNEINKFNKTNKFWYLTRKNLKRWINISEFFIFF